jgi:hypothetical protein
LPCQCPVIVLWDQKHCDGKRVEAAALQRGRAFPVESLNVSVASGVCLFEAVRQRSVKKK